MIHVLESIDLARHIAPHVFERVAFTEPRTLCACPLLGVSRAVRAIYVSLLDDYLVIHDPLCHSIECRWRQGGWVFFMKPFGLDWQRLSATPHPEPWSFTLCQHLARRSQTRHELLENEMQERFSIIDPMILLYLINLPPELGEFSDRYVIPMLTMLWKGACRKRPNIPCDASRGLHGQPLGEHLD